ncbi:MAG: hypothetical protein HKN91_13325 [Acidimicrobiia bacterium]|nr:hypothetical protein [Acidimicrobiia bacterium]
MATAKVRSLTWAALGIGAMAVVMFVGVENRWFMTPECENVYDDWAQDAARGSSGDTVDESLTLACIDQDGHVIELISDGCNLGVRNPGTGEGFLTAAGCL